MKVLKNINYIFWIIYYIITSSIYRWFDKTGHKSLNQHKKWGIQLLNNYDITLNITGLENIRKDTAYIITPNHQSMLDIPIVFTIFKDLKFRFIVKSEYYKIPFLSSGLKSGEHFAIDRKNFKKGLKTIELAAEDAKNNNCSLVIFPEGTRSPDGKIMDFKKGISLLLQKAKLPVLPVVIKGSFDIWPKSKFFPLSVNKNVVNVKILEPIEYNVTNKKERNDFVNSLQKTIEDVFNSID
jgi:1-acyl-sn-glycerol-3-phosphate acyltransferase